MMQAYFTALGVILSAGLFTWLYSVYKHNVNIVDSLWSLMFLMAAAVYLNHASELSERQLIIFTLVTIWALRLSFHLLYRNWGKTEDRRYQDIRRNNEPFPLKSLYIVFGLQGLLAWIISAPLLVALSSPMPLSGLDYLAIALWLAGFIFEAGADWQLLRFTRNSENNGKTLASGFWRYSRHPNYFGEFCIWWAYFLFALSAGGWWTIFAPLLMTILLLRVSGIALMEKKIGLTRPGYREYVEQTNAFFPGPVKSAKSQHHQGFAK